MQSRRDHTFDKLENPGNILEQTSWLRDKEWSICFFGLLIYKKFFLWTSKFKLCLSMYLFLAFYPFRHTQYTFILCLNTRYICFRMPLILRVILSFPPGLPISRTLWIPDPNLSEIYPPCIISILIMWLKKKYRLPNI